MDGRAVDISGGGVRVATKRDLPPGQNVMLRFSLPESDAEVLVRARVVLSFFDAARQAYAHGTAFTQIAREAQEAIGSFIDAAEQAES